jgi:hypothetical protein
MPGYSVQSIAQENAAPGLRDLRQQVSRISGQYYQNPNLRRMTLREALAGYGKGAGEIMSSANESATHEYATMMGIKSTNQRDAANRNREYELTEWNRLHGDEANNRGIPGSNAQNPNDNNLAASRQNLRQLATENRQRGYQLADRDENYRLKQMEANAEWERTVKEKTLNQQLSREDQEYQRKKQIEDRNLNYAWQRWVESQPQSGRLSTVRTR